MGGRKQAKKDWTLTFWSWRERGCLLWYNPNTSVSAFFHVWTWFHPWWPGARPSKCLPMFKSIISPVVHNKLLGESTLQLFLCMIYRVGLLLCFLRIIKHHVLKGLNNAYPESTSIVAVITYGKIFSEYLTKLSIIVLRIRSQEGVSLHFQPNTSMPPMHTTVLYCNFRPEQVPIIGLKSLWNPAQMSNQEREMAIKNHGSLIPCKLSSQECGLRKVQILHDERDVLHL